MQEIVPNALKQDKDENMQEFWTHTWDDGRIRRTITCVYDAGIPMHMHEW